MLSHYTPEQTAFLNNRKERIDEWPRINGRPDALELIEKGAGSFNGCVDNLSRLEAEIADYAWFAQQDLAAFKLHSYVVAKLMYISAKSTGEEGVLHEAEWFYPLLSDYEPIIRWGMAFRPESTFMKRRIANPNQNEYRYYQLKLALNGQWDELGSRADIFLKEIPSKMKKYAPDMRFYLALAQQSKAGMESALEELTSPKVAKVRNEVFELVVASEFISSFATLYAKTARRHGFVLDIDSMFIPNALLPVSPLSQYEDPYEFMRKYGI